MLPEPKTKRDVKIRGHFDNLIRHQDQKDFHSIVTDFLKILDSLLGRRKEDFLQLIKSNYGARDVDDRQLIALILTNNNQVYRLFIDFLNQNKSNGKQSASEH